MKHAYLIMAYNDFYLLKKLIQAIDNPDGDIFLHLDAGRNYNRKEIDEIKQSAKQSKIKIYSTLKISWGGQAKFAVSFF